MVFSSVIFIYYFLPLFLAIYYLTGRRNSVLVVGSALFYFWGEATYLLLLIGMVALNWWAGRLIGHHDGTRRQWLMIGFIALNLAILGFFKYAGFITANLAGIAAMAGIVIEPWSAHLPLGISFFTFQLISYLIDVGRRTTAPEPSIIKLATYIMMFPHLIAGPIVRYTDIKAELAWKNFQTERIGLGLQYFVIGLAQKVLIANILARASDPVFTALPGDLNILAAWIGVLSYTLQIYFDFCGYSNMAIGLAFLLGFRFPKNFDYPYAALSITDFWRRWHISLSSWFRDYVYIPLGGNRHGRFKTWRNLIVVFFLTGLWHGAAWSFVIWGLYHGLFLLLERAGWGAVLKRLPLMSRWFYSFFVVMMGWVIFRADDLSTAGRIFSVLFGFADGPGFRDPGAFEPVLTWFTPEVLAALIAGMIFCFPVTPVLLDQWRHRLYPPNAGIARYLDTSNVHVLPVTLIISLFTLSTVLLVGGSLNPFLYFQF